MGQKMIQDKMRKLHEGAATMDKDKLLKKAIDAYGEPAQMLMAIEEMSELTKELCKTFRYEYGISNIGSIMEEIADCKIMLRQMELIFGDAGAWERVKLERLDRRLKEKEGTDGQKIKSKR